MARSIRSVPVWVRSLLCTTAAIAFVAVVSVSFFKTPEIEVILLVGGFSTTAIFLAFGLTPPQE